MRTLTVKVPEELDLKLGAVAKKDEGEQIKLNPHGH